MRRQPASGMTMSDEFVDALLADFEQHGAATIARVRVEEPHTFLWLMTATVPNRVAITGSDALDVNSEALSAALAALGLDREN